MKRWLAGLAILTAAVPAFAGLEFYLTGEGRPGAVAKLTEESSHHAVGSVRLAEGADKSAAVLSPEVPAALASRSKTSLRLDGAMAYFRNGAEFKLSPDFSLSLFFKLQGERKKRQNLLTRTGDWFLDYIPGKKEIQFSPKGGAPVAVTVDPGKWLHLALVVKGNQAQFYLDGKAAGPVQTLSTSPGDSGQLYLGGASSKVSNAYAGLLDDVSIWNQALSAAEVASLAGGATPQSLLAAGNSLKRIPSKPFTTEQPRSRLAAFDPASAVIAIQKDGRGNELAGYVQQRFQDAWGVKLPIREIADHHDGKENLILFGGRNGNMLLRELTANLLIRPNGTGAEYRIAPDVLDWRRSVLFLAGRDRDELTKSLDAFFKKYPKPEVLPNGYFCAAGLPKAPAPEELWKTMEARYADRSARPMNLALLNEMKAAALAYRDTGDDRYAEVFAKMTKLMLDQYEAKLPLSRNSPPTFEFHQYPQYLEEVEYSPKWTAADRRNAAELIRKVIEHTMDYYEMKTPSKMFDEGQVGYLTNHFNFAARTTYNNSRYLLDHYNYEPAKYWQAVAKHVFAGVENSPLSPEDAGGYQFLVYRIFTDYALSSGNYDLSFFKRPVYRDYVRYTKGIFNHLGYTPGYGDANPTGMASGYTVLKEAVDILGDDEAEFLLNWIADRSGTEFYKTVIDEMNLRRDLPPPGPKSELIGLNVFELDKARRQLCRYPDFALPVVSKAIFRSSFGDHADFLAFNGQAGAPHGHDDPTGISQYIRGNRLWLFEGNYIRRHAEDHNMVNVIRDGNAPDRRRNVINRSSAAQLVGSLETADRQAAELTMLLADYNGIDLLRHIGWDGETGFWVVDEMTAQTPGNYILQSQLRTTGNVTEDTQGAVVAQKTDPTGKESDHLTIRTGDRASNFVYSEMETCHGRPVTVLPGYRYSDRATRTLLTRRETKLAAGEKSFFFNFVEPFFGKKGAASPVELVRLASNAAAASENGKVQLAVAGAWSAPGISVDADICFITPRGILARKVRKLEVAGKSFTGDVAQTYAEAGLDAAKVNAVLAAAVAKGEKAVKSAPRQIDAPEIAPALTLSFPAPVTAEAMTKDTLAVGLTDGTFSLFSLDGKRLFERKFEREISLVAPIDADGKLLYIVGVRAKRINSVTEVADGAVYCLGADGKELWKAVIPAFARRYGDVSVAFPARLDGKDKSVSVIIGTEAQRYFAFDLAGKERWAYQCTHGATGGAAGDLDGDGRDEIFAGNEYYYHDIVSPDGKQLQRRTTSPWDAFGIITDLNGDGKNEVLAARYDGYLYTETLGENPLSGKVLNLGGQPTGLVKTADCLAAASWSGTVTFAAPDLTRRAYLTMPGPVTGLAPVKDGLWTACLDGFAYKVAADGVKGKAAIGYLPASLQRMNVVSNGEVAAVSSGNTVTLLK